MKKQTVLATILVLAAAVVAQQERDTGVATSPLTIYSAGLAVGAIRSLSDSLQSESKTFVKLSFIQDVYFTENIHLFADVDWLAPRANCGAEAGIDYLLLTSRVRPFVGAGAGVRYFDKKGNAFGDNFGPAATLHAGLVLDISQTMQVRVRIPFHATFNQNRDYGAGLDIGLLFSKPYRHVKKFEY